MTPNLDWYLSISRQQQLSPRCPYATVYHCPRYYQSVSLLGSAGSTGIAPAEDSRLQEQWKQTEVWPVTAEQETSISGPGNEIKHYIRFCPEVSFDRFGLFAAELHRFADEIDVDCTHKLLREEGATSEDWRWNWSLVGAMHYTECPLYSLLMVGKGKDGLKPEITLSERQRERKDRERNQTVWDRVLRHPVYVILTILAAIASLIGVPALFRGSDGNNKMSSPPISQLHEEAKGPAMRNSSSSSVAPPTTVREHPKNIIFAESVARIKVKLRSGISYEQLVELLDEARVAKTMSGDIAPEQMRQLICYEELEGLWNEKTPNALLQKGIVSNWEEAKREYYLNEEPIIKQKMTECYSY